MIKIDYPDHPFRIRREPARELIFDELRKLWLKLTPEEWVRQNFVRFLIDVRGYPATLLALEKSIKIGELAKRFDILVYSPDHQPWMMIECKSMDVPLSGQVLDQVLRYNIAVPVSFLVITNGSYCMAFKREGLQLLPLTAFPDYPADQGKIPSSA